tara:strand:+ start:659 stop:835 length:177 start_codon:yes stop_codon:yes gene_type:complete
MILESFNTVLQELTQAIEQDAEKCERGNASAGRRLRKASMNAIKQLKVIRAAILEQQK